MGNTHLRGFRRGHCQGRTTGQNVEANFSFITILSRAAPIFAHILVHSISFSLESTMFQAVVDLRV